MQKNQILAVKNKYHKWQKSDLKTINFKNQKGKNKKTVERARESNANMSCTNE